MPENVPAGGTFHPMAGSPAGDVLNSVIARQIGNGRAIGKRDADDRLNALFALSFAARRSVMFSQPRYSRAISAQVGEVERRLRSLEQRLERAGDHAPATARHAADRAGDVIASALGSIVDRFRGDSDSIGDAATKIGGQAAKIGDDALRRLSKEVEHRPLVTLAVAVGVGILVGAISRRH